MHTHATSTDLEVLMVNNLTKMWGHIGEVLKQSALYMMKCQWMGKFLYWQSLISESWMYAELATCGRSMHCIEMPLCNEMLNVPLEDYDKQLSQCFV